MRPDPTEVRSWFASPMDAATLSRYIAALRADPNWRVVRLDGGGTDTLILLYFPTGERLEIVLTQQGSHWTPTQIRP